MEKNFWLDIWNKGMIGFHASEYHPKLIEHLSKFTLKDKPHTFVPLCGKSLDMLYLVEQGHHVTAVEICPIAVESFFKENSIEFTKEENDHHACYRSEKLTIYCGDYFTLNKNYIGHIDFVYDRASNIALPYKMRTEYYKKMAELTSTDSQFLIINFEHDNENVPGPPFSVKSDEIITHYQNLFECDVEILEAFSKKITIERFTSLGLAKADYKVIKIKRK